MKTIRLITTGLILLSLFSCQEGKKVESKSSSSTQKAAATSLLGEELFAAEPSESLLEKYETHKANYEANPEDADLLIWYGRFIAYQGKYEEAIQVYSDGIKQFPDDARFYRHRGHRYISIRKFDEAIADFQKAAELREGKENEVEPDGMPNALNIPVSTLHGNIYYHLGLAHYLNHEFPLALEAYKKCLATSSNPDNVVSASNWLYMISRRMGDEAGANAYMGSIHDSLEIIENFNYHDIDLFYKGELSMEELEEKAESPGSGADAINYAIGNWYFYNGEKEKAKAVFKKILEGDSWSSFGFIAAEKDIAVHFR
ncbi:MAG: tetratricopeptide repeat protein [Bacteroidota bacterium]